MIEIEDAPRFYSPDPLPIGQRVRVRLNGECLGRRYAWNKGQPYPHDDREAALVGVGVVVWMSTIPQAQDDGHDYVVGFKVGEFDHVMRFYRGELERVNA